MKSHKIHLKVIFKHILYSYLFYLLDDPISSLTAIGQVVRYICSTLYQAFWIILN